MLPTPNPPAPRRTRRLAPWLIALLVVVLLAAAMAAVAARRSSGQGGEVGARGPSTTGPGPTASSGLPGETTSTTAGPPGGSSLPATQKAKLDELQAQVAELLRGLSWRGPLDLRVVSRKELAQRFREAVDRDTDPAQVAAEEATLKLLGLIPADLDYGKLIVDVYSQVVLGFYDPLTKQLFVGGDGGQIELDAATRWVTAHEMTHALTDQVFNYGPATDALYKADRADEAAAYSALLEGDAVLLQDAWAEKYLTPTEQLEIAFGGAGGDVDAYAKAPVYVQKDLLFPYDSGKDFVQALHDAGGYAAVDAAYRKPPTSTEQILHPETYQAGQASTPPSLPNVAAATGCTSVRTGTLGQFDMGALLDSHLSEADASRAVEGWNGDAYGVVRCGTALGMAERWETDPGSDPARLVDALSRWAAQWSGSGRGPGADGRFSGSSGAGRVVRNGSRVDLVVAQDAATADKLINALAGA